MRSRPAQCRVGKAGLPYLERHLQCDARRHWLDWEGQLWLPAGSRPLYTPRRRRRRIVASAQWGSRLLPEAVVSSSVRCGEEMLSRLSVRWLRPLPALPLGPLSVRLAPVPTDSAKRSALPVWAVAPVSAVGPGGAGGWYEALATSAPVQGAEDVLLNVHSATGLPWWGSILLTTVALRGAITLPLAAYQHYILAKVRGANRAWTLRICFRGEQWLRSA